MFFYSKFIGTSTLCYSDNLCMLYMIDTSNESQIAESRGIKRKLLNENSYSLWYKHLGHISKKRINKLVMARILEVLNKIDNDEICVECIKGKMANKKIHTDIYEPFLIVA